MLFSYLCLYAVTIVSPNDSLINLLNDAQKAGNLQRQSYYLNSIGFDWYWRDQFDSSLSCFHRALRINTKLKNDTLAGQNCNNIGLVYYQMGLLDSALAYYERARAAFQKHADSEKAAIAGLNLSMIYYDKGAYDKSLELALEAAPPLASSNSLQALGSCFNTIALVYSRLKDHPTALEYHHKALTTRKRTNNKKGVAHSYNNIANIHKDSKTYDSALFYYNRSLKLKSELNDLPGSASTLNNMGEVMLALNRLPEAEEFLLESLRIKQQSGNRAGEIYSCNNLAQLALVRKNYREAKRYLDITEKEAATLGLLDELRKSYALRIRLLKETNDPARAFNYSERLMQVKDSLLTREKVEALAEIQTAYEIEQRDNQIILLEKERALQQYALEISGTRVRWLLMIVAFTICTVGLIYWQYSREQQNKKRYRTLLQELHHRVKNNLQILSSVLSLQVEQMTDAHAMQAVKSSESRVNAMALIHRKLYARDQDRTINIKDYITELVTYLVHTYGFDDRQIDLKLTLQDVQVDVDKAIPLGLVINELISNAFKHAYADHPAPALTVDLRHGEKGELWIDIWDNGNCIRTGRERRSGSFGLRLVNMLMNELKGRYEMNTQQGTRYQLVIPYKNGQN